MQNLILKVPFMKVRFLFYFSFITLSIISCKRNNSEVNAAGNEKPVLSDPRIDQKELDELIAFTDQDVGQSGHRAQKS